MNEPAVYIGLDVGAKRIGVARGNSLARLAAPLRIVEVSGQELAEIQRIAAEENASALVVGLPRGLNGQETEQTQVSREFGKKLEGLGFEVHFQDEAGTSKQAAQENLKNPKSYKKRGRLDHKAAAIMLQDFLDNLNP